jgi:hypothetical protein
MSAASSCSSAQRGYAEAVTLGRGKSPVPSPPSARSRMRLHPCWSVKSQVTRSEILAAYAWQDFRPSSKQVRPPHHREVTRPFEADLGTEACDSLLIACSSPRSSGCCGVRLRASQDSSRPPPTPVSKFSSLVGLGRGGLGVERARKVRVTVSTGQSNARARDDHALGDWPSAVCDTTSSIAWTQWSAGGTWFGVCS